MKMKKHKRSTSTSSQHQQQQSQSSQHQHQHNHNNLKNLPHERGHDTKVHQLRKNHPLGNFSEAEAEVIRNGNSTDGLELVNARAHVPVKQQPVVQAAVVSSFDNIVCTIGQKIPTTESIVTVELGDLFPETNEYYIQNVDTMMLSLEDSENYYEKLCEIDLNSGSGSGSRRSSSCSTNDCPRFDFVHTCNSSNSNSSNEARTSTSPTTSNNTVTCSISNVLSHNCGQVFDGNVSATVTSITGNSSSRTYNEPEYSNVQPQPRISHPCANRAQLPLPYSIGIRQLLQLSGPIPPLAVLNPDGTISRTITHENELDSLDLALFEKRPGIETAETTSSPPLTLTAAAAVESNHNHCGGSFPSPSAFIRSASKNFSRSSISSENSGNYWLDAGNEFEFISAASVINNLHQSNQSKSEDEHRRRKLKKNCKTTRTGTPTSSLSPSPPYSASSPVPPNTTDTIMEEDDSNGIYEEFYDVKSSGSSAGNTHQRFTYRSSSTTHSLQHDTSYDKAIGNSAPITIQQQQQAFNRRRGSLPLTMTSGIVVQDPANTEHNTTSTQPSCNSASSSLSSTSRLVNFFAKRSFKVPSGNQLLNRTKSSNKLDQKVTTSSSGSNSMTREQTERHSKNDGETGTSAPAHLINAQSIHPSVINNQHGFVTTSSDGTTQYYSCKTRSERDTWLRAIQQSIYHAEKSRVDNSLTVWVLEGKEIGKSNSISKRYHCEIFLDNKLYGRTNGKAKSELLFWGEEFVFNQIQVTESSELSVSVWRKESTKKSGSKRRKEKKKELIGTIKIPLKTLESRHLVEKWYPITLETPSTKQKPTLRLKCKYESVRILPLSAYRPLLDFVQENYKFLCDHLEPLLSVKGKEDIAEALTNVLHHQSIAKKFVAELALSEIVRGADDKLTFRGNSIATKSMESYLKLLGPPFLEATLGPFIEKFQNCDLYDCEVDPMRIQQITHLSRNQSNLRLCVDNIWRSIANGIDLFPTELKECFSYCRQDLRSVGREELTGHLISASVFLRFLCPAILSPSLFHITNEYPNEKAARNLMLIAKVIQTLANFTRFASKENYMEFINDYVEKEAEVMKNFLIRISTNSSAMSCQIQSVQPQVTSVDLGKWLSVLVTLLSESIDQLLPKNEKFRTLYDILKRLRNPQQHSPPPMTSPPPAPLPNPIGTSVINTSVNQQAVPAYAIGNIISQSAIPLHVVQHFRTSGQSPEPQTASSGYQSQSPTPLNFSNPTFANNEALDGLEKAVSGLPQQRPMTRQAFSSSSCTDDEDDETYATRTVSSARPAQKLRPITNPLLQKNQPQFRSTAALELHRNSHPTRTTPSTYNNLSSSDSDSGIANHVHPSSRSRKLKFSNRRSPDGCQEPAESKTLEEYENEMIELRKAMEVLQVKLSRAEERLFRHPQSGAVPARPRSSTATSADIFQQERRLSTASTTREMEMEGLLQRLLSAEEEMKREQDLLSALDQKQKLISAQEQKINHLDTVNSQLITALSKIHSNLQQQPCQTDSPNRPSSLPLPNNNSDIINNNNSTIVRITTGGEPPVIKCDDRSMSPDSLNGSPTVQDTLFSPQGKTTGDSRVVIGEHELKLLAELKSSSC